MAEQPIAAVRGATTPQIQALFLEFAAWLGSQAKVAGVVEETPAGGEAQLRSLPDGQVYRVFQELGSGSGACGLDAGSVVGACEAVRRQIAAGCDLVVLSKFGKLEADRTGLAEAFASGLTAGTPILTSVGAKYDAAWARFASPFYVLLPPELAALQAWWRRVQAQRQAA